MSVTTEALLPVLRATTLAAVAAPCRRLAFLTCKPDLVPACPVLPFLVVALLADLNVQQHQRCTGSQGG